MATATVNSTSGVNLNYGANNYLDTVGDGFNPATGQYGYFNVPSSAGSYTGATEYAVATADNDGDGIFDDGSAWIANGNFNYSRGALSGTVDSLSFGEGLSGITAAGTGYTSTDTSLVSTDVSLTNLNMTGSDVNTVLYGLMNGDESGLENWLATHSVTFNGNSGADAYQGGSQADTLNGNAGNDILAGGGGADALNGGNGSDILTGGAGADALNGGNGSDTFVFVAASDSTVSAFDTISSFSVSGLGGVDVLDVSALGLSGGYSGSTAASDSLWYDSTDGKFYADTDGDATADFAVAATVSGTLTSANFDFA